MSGTPITVGALLLGDEFDGPAGAKPDPTKWTGKLHGLSGGIHLDGLTNIQLDGNSHLQITAHKMADGWHSGFLSSFTLKNGDPDPACAISGPRYIEAKVKVAKGQGCWNGAIWQWAYPYGAGGIEVDVCEQLGREPSRFHSTIHNWRDGDKQLGWTIADPGGATLGDDFHIYGCALHHDVAVFYLDGKPMKNLRGAPAVIKASDVGLIDFGSFPVATNISLNMGGWGGAVTIPGPVSLLCDFVHVYRLAS